MSLWFRIRVLGPARPVTPCTACTGVSFASVAIHEPIIRHVPYSRSPGLWNSDAHPSRLSRGLQTLIELPSYNIRWHRLHAPVVTLLGQDTAHRNCNLNGNAFQQDAIISFKGWQYAVFYSSCSPSGPENDLQLEPLFVYLARRKLPDTEWQTIVFDDYRQTTDDGHNTVQMGICPGDGTIHLSYDHHCDVLRYRYSIEGIASDPERFRWSKDVFTSTLDHVPGIDLPHENFGYVTYPCIGTLGDNMFFSIRNGKAGLGDDLLYIYRAATGIQNNPYVHGMDYRDGKLHTTWVYRGFVHYDGWDDPLDAKHKQQAGPNGAENNHNICYAYSNDGGYTWKNGQDESIASLKEGGSITPDCPVLVAFEIPKGRGLTNQEARAVDQEGGSLWKHYYRFPHVRTWTQNIIGPVPSPRRGRLAIGKTGDLFLILPNPTNSSLRILKSSKAKAYADAVEIWSGVGFMGEPLVDIKRLEEEDILSVFAIAKSATSSEDRQVVVLDFRI
ncbi:hypothetical protein BDP81DRAFT_465425 [Colletotrichum phormii]|uniref:Dockerin type 1 n=1 Tax=Colletotrichum phormii TaxID=359342 RepID=A0AAI9ZF84_9PEZI|nr:uncharacterized protein BDP81DRAFT_465425 [Colletotrichum phormii]KAK1623197.1 hypothetical protein BDP81DRAFT_465425 [Colletotrichum phormii]